MINKILGHAGSSSAIYKISGGEKETGHRHCVTEHEGHEQGRVRIDKIVYGVSDKGEVRLWWKTNGGFPLAFAGLGGRGLLDCNSVMGLQAPKDSDGHVYLSVHGPEEVQFFIGLDCTKL